MATVTPNFNWPVPTPTDLVKDGATAIEALGDSIDASLVDLKGGTTGQVLSKTTGTDMDFTWVTTDDANAIQNSIVNAKGDLIGASANDTPAILSVGANGQVLVADSTAATGLKWANSGNFIGCRVYLLANQTIANATDTFVNFAAETFDTNGFHDNVTNNTRITIPAGLAGYYRVTANSRFDANATGRRLHTIALNAGAVANGEATPGATSYLGVTQTGTVYMNVGDYVQLAIYQTSGGNLSMLANPTDTFMEIERLGS
jgi:hypothetical protein